MTSSRSRSHESTDRARSLLLSHDVRTLPVTDPRHDRIVGTVGLRELAGSGASVGSRMSPAITCGAGTSIVALTPALTDGKTHAVVVVDDLNEVIGIVTQTDVLAALAKLLPVAE